jgi:hypothetical protein
MVEMTFTFDDATAAKLRQSAARLDKSLREVVCEAIDDYSDRVWQLGEREKRHLLRVVNDMMPAMTAADENRADEPVEARRAGGRRRR